MYRSLFRPCKPKTVDVPKCEKCGGPREFEFQLIPTLLHFLNVRRRTAPVFFVFALVLVFLEFSFWSLVSSFWLWLSKLICESSSPSSACTFRWMTRLGLIGAWWPCTRATTRVVAIASTMNLSTSRTTTEPQKQRVVIFVFIMYSFCCESLAFYRPNTPTSRTNPPHCWSIVDRDTTSAASVCPSLLVAVFVFQLITGICVPTYC